MDNLLHAIIFISMDNILYAIILYLFQWITYRMQLYYIMLVRLTDSFLEELRLVLPRDKCEINRYRGEYHQTAVS